MEFFGSTSEEEKLHSCKEAGDTFFFLFFSFFLPFWLMTRDDDTNHLSNSFVTANIQLIQWRFLSILSWSS